MCEASPEDRFIARALHIIFIALTMLTGAGFIGGSILGLAIWLLFF